MAKVTQNLGFCHSGSKILIFTEVHGYSLDDNQRRKEGLFWAKNPICDCSRTNQMPYTNQITKMAPYMCTDYHLITVIQNCDIF